MYKKPTEVIPAQGIKSLYTADYQANRECCIVIYPMRQKIQTGQRSFLIACSSEYDKENWATQIGRSNVDLGKMLAEKKFAFKE